MQNGDEKAEMAFDIIPQFLRDLNVKTITVEKVNKYKYDINWGQFVDDMREKHPYIKIKLM